MTFNLAQAFWALSLSTPSMRLCATACSCVSIRTAKGIHVLEIDGQRTVPSIVAFTDKDYLVGKPARAQVCAEYKPHTGRCNPAS